MLWLQGFLGSESKFSAALADRNKVEKNQNISCKTQITEDCISNLNQFNFSNRTKKQAEDIDNLCKTLVNTFHNLN